MALPSFHDCRPHGIHAPFCPRKGEGDNSGEYGGIPSTVISREKFLPLSFMTLPGIAPSAYPHRCAVPQDYDRAVSGTKFRRRFVMNIFFFHDAPGVAPSAYPRCGVPQDAI
ncbi:MAG: hypothetical protein KA091_02585 [Methanoregulaceae archaeon]|nr:hypothetical protein [Methanoregulaceae archaeon]